MVIAFLDLNVVLDLLLQRGDWAEQAESLARASRAGSIRAIVSAASITTLYYVCRKLVGHDAARRAVEECVAVFEIAPVDSAVIRTAIALPIADIEDAVQAACARHANAELIVTRDARGFAQSPVPALSPSEFLARLDTPPAPAGDGPSPA